MGEHHLERRLERLERALIALARYVVTEEQIQDTEIARLFAEITKPQLQTSAITVTVKGVS